MSELRIRRTVQAANKLGVDLRSAFCNLLCNLACAAKILSDEYQSELANLGIIDNAPTPKVAELSIDEAARLAIRMIKDKNVGLTDEIAYNELIYVLYHLETSDANIAQIITRATTNYERNMNTFPQRFMSSVTNLYRGFPNVAKHMHVIAPLFEWLQHDEMTIDSRHMLMKIYQDISSCGAFNVTGKINIVNSYDDPFVEEIAITHVEDANFTCTDFLDIWALIDEMIDYETRIDDGFMRLANFRSSLRVHVNLAILSAGKDDDVLMHLRRFNAVA